MEYVANGFSPNMVNGDFNLQFTVINKTEFMSAIKTAYSIIGHEDIAAALNVEYNRESITLTDGDILYLVTPKYRPKIESGEYQFISDMNQWVFRRVEVKQ